MENLIFSEEQLDLFKDVSDGVSEVVSENTLPPETDEEGCDSFDDLVYVEPRESCRLLLSNLSEDQEKFIQGNLEFDERFTKIYYHDMLYYTFSERDWIYALESGIVNNYVTFNDIFIHKDDLEKE